MTEAQFLAVRNLIAKQRNAVLCTAHAAMEGWPFGSIVPYAVLPTGDLAVFLSDISEHSKNLHSDARATIFVADPSASEAPQAGARHAMLIKAHRPTGKEESDAEAHYFARFPDAERMRDTHSFNIWVLECHRIRWIAGFGGMGWIERAQWIENPTQLDT